MSSLSDGSLGRATSWGDLKNSSPFREPASQRIVFSASLAEAVETLGGGLAIGSADWHETGVDLDTTMDAAISEDFGEFDSRFGCVPNGFVEHDNAADILTQPRSCKEELAICLPIGMGILDIDLVEPLSDRTSRLIRSQYTFTRCTDLSSCLDQF